MQRQNRDKKKQIPGIVKPGNQTTVISIIPKNLCKIALEEFAKNILVDLDKNERKRFTEMALKDFDNSSAFASIQICNNLIEDFQSGRIMSNSDFYKLTEKDLDQDDKNRIEIVMGLFGDELARETIYDMAEKDSKDIDNFGCGIESLINVVNTNLIHTLHDDGINPAVKAGVFSISSSIANFLEKVKEHAKTLVGMEDMPIRLYLSNEDNPSSFGIKIGVSYGENDIEKGESSKDKILFIRGDKETGMYNLLSANRIGNNTQIAEHLIDIPYEKLDKLIWNGKMITPSALIAILYGGEEIKTDPVFDFSKSSAIEEPLLNTAEEKTTEEKTVSSSQKEFNLEKKMAEQEQKAEREEEPGTFRFDGR